jgi:hypothetical protein
MLLDRSTLNALADFGEAATLVPAAVAVALALACARRPRDAAAWMAAIGGCILLTAALKTAFASNAALVEEFRAVGFPSGHAALSLAFYGTGALVVLNAAGPRWARLLLSVALAALGGMVVYAVWRLHWHTTPALVAGGALGVAAMLAFQAIATPAVLPLRAGGLALAAAAAMVLLLHGSRLQYEPENATMLLRMVAL